MTVIIAGLLLLIAFYLLSVLTEQFFVPSIDKLANKLKLSTDASGATLLAAGSSAPEFFTSLFAVLGLAGAEADIGAGTIVGSAIFNVLVIVGAAALYKAVKLQWQPVIRDLIFYIITILLLLWAFWDGRVVLLEALVFVAFYVFYVFAVVNWRKVVKYKDFDQEVMHEPPMGKLSSSVTRIIGWVVPSPSKYSRLYLVTFLMSILAIAGLSWVLVEQIIIIAGALNINATFLALTVLAAGTSIPDLIGSLVVAKQGRGDMAVSNAVGSNIFDILFGLGLPWLLVIGLRGEAIQVSRDNLQASILLLFATVVATLFLLIARKWHLGRKSGLVLIALYVAYCVYIFVSVA
jgi:K+-dependent Na+/Ca+ exchanger-like protein